MGRLKPLNDFIFQKLFGEKGREYEVLSLLNAILFGAEEQIVNVEIVDNKRLIVEMLGAKTGMIEIRAYTNLGTYINIEVLRKDYGTMHIRSPFNLGMMVSKTIRENDECNALTKAVTINLLDSEYTKLPEFHTIFHLREDKHTQHVLTDRIEVHYIEMPKFRRMKEKDYTNPLHRWLSFFDNKTPETILYELTMMDSAIQKSNDYLNTLSDDVETMWLYQSSEKASLDFKSSIVNAKRDIKIEVARNFLDVLSVEDIAERMMLPVMEVQRLKDEFKLTPDSPDK